MKIHIILTEFIQILEQKVTLLKYKVKYQTRNSNANFQAWFTERSQFPAENKANC